jgi:hypothetical protein
VILITAGGLIFLLPLFISFFKKWKPFYFGYLQFFGWV